MTKKTPDYKLTFGADPEFFILDPKTKQVTISCGKLGGTKGAPKPLGELGGYLEDNVTVEFNPLHSSTGRGLWGNLEALKAEFTKTTKFQLAPYQEWQFSDKELDAHPLAMQFGCDPDFDAYQGGQARKRIDPKDTANWRFCGGHIHIGIDPWPEIPKHIFVQLLDFFCYSSWAQHDTAYERARFYGKPGLFRPKTYGVEYRTPSNFWASPANPEKRLRDFPHFVERTVRRILWLLVNDRARLTNMYRNIDWLAVAIFFEKGGAHKGCSDYDYYHEFNDIREWGGKTPDTSKTDVINLDELLAPQAMPRLWHNINENRLVGVAEALDAVPAIPPRADGRAAGEIGLRVDARARARLQADMAAWQLRLNELHNQRGQGGARQHAREVIADLHTQIRAIDVRVAAELLDG